MLPSLALAYYLVINIVTFAMYGYDKNSAQHGRWRTRESALLGLSLAGGAFGGLLGMNLFHHKTQKPIFWVVNLIGCAVHLYLIIIVLRA
jgi:uncharacterized membrane protein YsdA (DUF1294 family)